MPVDRRARCDNPLATDVRPQSRVAAPVTQACETRLPYAYPVVRAGARPPVPWSLSCRSGFICRSSLHRPSSSMHPAPSTSSR
ncbi:conserved hypothetical protein [Burkholderia vietnamiensis]|nr:conserved hypothetical protein [Burkholderia vietnamiensis]